MNNKILAIIVVAVVAVAGIAGALLMTGALNGKAAEEKKDTTMATFEVLSISSNHKVLLVEDEFQVTVEVKNTGTRDGNYTANLTQDHELLSSKNVSVKMGEVKTVLFDLVAEAAGEGTIEIENKSTTVSVHETVAMGDYRLYHLQGYDSSLGQPVDQYWNYSIVAMDDATYTTRFTVVGSAEEPTEIVSIQGTQWTTGRANLVLVGAEGVTTYLGAMTLNHYRQVVDGLTYDYWVHFRGNVMIKMTITDGTDTITGTLTDTNCEWLADI